MSRRKISNKSAKIFVLSSPSGGGKTTLSQVILSRVPRMVRSISMTTRQPRTGEKNGKDYFFVTQNEFDRVAGRNGFLEMALVFGNSYGTPRDYVEKVLESGKDILLLIDVQGAIQIREQCPNSVLIFVMPPSIDTLKHRLVKRSTESRLEMAKRLKVAQIEIEMRSEYDYVIENKKLDDAARDLEAVIRAERLKVKAGR